MQRQPTGLFLRICNIVLAVACYLPLIWVIAFGSYVARAAIKLGHLPKYIYSPIFVFIFALLTRPLSQSTFRMVNLILYGVGILLSFVEITGFFEWYVD